MRSRLGSLAAVLGALVLNVGPRAVAPHVRPVPAPPPERSTPILDTGTAGAHWSLGSGVWEAVVEREVVALHGAQPIAAAFATWATLEGTRFRPRLVGTADTTARTPRRDGVSRVHLRPELCERGVVARAELFSGGVRVEDGRLVTFVDEADIGICADRVADPWRLQVALTHEIGHVAGLDHVDADTGDPCAVMAPRLARCARMTAEDRRAVAWLHPARGGAAQPRPPEGRARGSASPSAPADVPRSGASPVSHHDRGRTATTTPPRPR